MEDEKVHPDYLKGFNDSYLLSKHLPELAAQLAIAKGDTPRMQGMRDGRQQYLSEQVKAKMPSWLKQERTGKDDASSSTSKTRDVEPPSK